MAPIAPPSHRPDRPFGRRRFAAGVALLLGAYLGLQAVYVLRLPLVMDELQGAAAVHRLSEEVPYRDFQPYKTVVGYYLQLPVLLAAPDPWSGLLLVKMEIALLVAATLAWAAFRLVRRLRPGPVLLALALLLAMSTFLERSAELRVDMLTGLAGLVALVLLLEPERRGEGWAGGWAAVAFLVSQKGAFYALAGGAALAVSWLARRDRTSLAAATRFVAAGLAVAAAYALIWTLAAGGDLLADTVDPARRVLGGAYRLRQEFWTQTLVRNPAFYLLSAAALALVAHRGWRGGQGGESARRLAVFAAVLIGLCLWYEQPWPYFFVLLLPTLMVVQAAGADELLAGGWWRRQTGRVRALLLALVVVAGIVHPLATRVPRVLARDNGFQRHNLELAAAILAPGETYLAGVELLRDRRQAHRRLAWIDQRAQSNLHALPERELRELIAELEAAPPKLVVWSYRIANLPQLLQGHLARRYRHLTANLLVYSPLVPAGDSAVSLAFGAEYLVELAGEGACTLDGRPVERHQRVRLTAGRHVTRCEVPMRLTLVPAGIERRVVADYHAPRSMFPAIYHY